MLLQYDRPADYFEESLPIGNGKLGALVYGGTDDNIIYLNDITLWTGTLTLMPISGFQRSARLSSMKTINSQTHCNTMCRDQTRSISSRWVRYISRIWGLEPSATIIAL